MKHVKSFVVGAAVLSAIIVLVFGAVYAVVHYPICTGGAFLFGMFIIVAYNIGRGILYPNERSEYY